MKYYKVIKDGRVIDALDKLTYVRYQEKHNRMLLCSVEDAQAILSSDGKYAWHENSLRVIPVDGYDTIELEEIDVYEYNQLKCLNMKTPNEIIKEYTLQLMEGGIL